MSGRCSHKPNGKDSLHLATAISRSSNSKFVHRPCQMHQARLRVPWSPGSPSSSQSGTMASATRTVLLARPQCPSPRKHGRALRTFLLCSSFIRAGLHRRALSISACSSACRNCFDTLSGSLDGELWQWATAIQSFGLSHTDKAFQQNHSTLSFWWTRPAACVQPWNGGQMHPSSSAVCIAKVYMLRTKWPVPRFMRKPQYFQ